MNGLISKIIVVVAAVLIAAADTASAQSAQGRRDGGDRGQRGDNGWSDDNGGDNGWDGRDDWSDDGRDRGDWGDDRDWGRSDWRGGRWDDRRDRGRSDGGSDPAWGVYRGRGIGYGWARRGGYGGRNDYYTDDYYNRNRNELGLGTGWEDSDTNMGWYNPGTYWGNTWNYGWGGF